MQLFRQKHIRHVICSPKLHVLSDAYIMFHISLLVHTESVPLLSLNKTLEKFCVGMIKLSNELSYPFLQSSEDLANITSSLQ